MPITKQKGCRDANYATGTGPLFEELESRLLLSADVGAVLTTPVAEPAIVQQVDLQPSAPPAASVTQAAADTRKELVLIDPRVQDYSKLVTDLLAPRSDGR